MLIFKLKIIQSTFTQKIINFEEGLKLELHKKISKIINF